MEEPGTLLDTGGPSPEGEGGKARDSGFLVDVWVRPGRMQVGITRARAPQNNVQEAHRGGSEMTHHAHESGQGGIHGCWGTPLCGTCCRLRGGQGEGSVPTDGGGGVPRDGSRK